MNRKPQQTQNRAHPAHRRSTMSLSEATLRTPESTRDELRAESRSGSFHELSAQEFAQRTDLRVLVIKAPHGATYFRNHVHAMALADCRAAEDYLRQFDSPQTVGLVCCDGEKSAHLAIRLSRQGHTVMHLAGGLMEWCETFC
ncbi:MAG: hypothetical protein OEW39_08865 [Deltaproteobacteria bacterium]|nr:hypothetical protein [Deltaproteobacteria bacterium]